MDCKVSLSDILVSGQEACTAHFSLNATSIRSTSTSRWNADASRESNCSNSRSGGVFDDDSDLGLDVSLDMAHFVKLEPPGRLARECVVDQSRVTYALEVPEVPIVADMLTRFIPLKRTPHWPTLASPSHPFQLLLTAYSIQFIIVSLRHVVLPHRGRLSCSHGIRVRRVHRGGPSS